MTENNNPTILVTGATGNLGSEVVKALSAKGVNVKAASRNPGKMAPVEGVQPVKFDYLDPGTYEGALKDVSSVFLVALPLDAKAFEKLTPFIDAAKGAGVKNIVLNSALGMDQMEESPLRKLEKYLMDSGLDFTILRPNFFMENFSAGWIAPMIAQNGGIFIAADKGKTSFISTSDIAKVAAKVLTESGHNRKEYNLTGPEGLSHGEVAEIIAQARNKPVMYQSISEEDMVAGGKANGMPEDAVQYMAHLYQAVRAGYAGHSTDDAAGMIEGDQLSFREFARKNANVWK